MLIAQEKIETEVGFLPDDQQEGPDDIADVDIFQKGEAVVTWSTDWTAFTVVDQIKRNIIDLNPKFQRRQAWSVSKRSELIFSLLTSIPIPQIVLAENPYQRGKYIVIDGKQRLMSLAQFIGADNYEPFKLRVENKAINGKGYGELDESYRIAIDNAIIRTVVLKNTNDDFLYSVFLKLNMGSTMLSPQELRQAFVPGEFTEYVDDFTVGNTEKNICASVGLQKVTRLKYADPRMRDTELALRYFSFVNNVENYRGNLKRFLDEFSLKMNKDWENSKHKIFQQAVEFDHAVSFAIEVFDENNIGRKWNGNKYEGPLNRAVFDVIFYYFSKPDIREASRSKHIEIKKAFEDLCVNDAAFKEAIESSTKNLDRTKNRFILWGCALKSIIGESVVIPNFQ